MVIHNIPFIINLFNIYLHSRTFLRQILYTLLHFCCYACICCIAAMQFFFFFFIYIVIKQNDLGDFILYKLYLPSYLNRVMDC